jgi:hypothetical protein
MVYDQTMRRQIAWMFVSFAMTASAAGAIILVGLQIG